MATAAPIPALLTYDAYMAEPQVEGRYDIMEGVRVFMPGASWEHQEIVSNVLERLRALGRKTGIGRAIPAPFDVLIRRIPKLQTRQPDVLFVSYPRLSLGGGIPASGPLTVAPELVVEVISDTETQRLLESKITDYIAIGVDECWVVRPEARTVEILRLTPGGSLSLGLYDETQSVTSTVFPTLTVPVADFFRP